MRVLLDTNVVLDVLLDRAPFAADSSSVWAACDSGQLTGFLSASSLTDVFYIARRTSGIAAARAAVGLCLATFEIAPLDRQTLEDATMFAGNDFEDNVQLASALRSGLAAIVTRNGEDFIDAAIAILTPQALLAQL